MFIPLGTGREVSRLLPSENLGLLCEGEVKVHEGETIPVFKIIRIGVWIRSGGWLCKFLSMPLRIESPLCEPPHSSLGSHK